MKTDIETLKESFWNGYDNYEESRKESEEIWNMYHNRQWTSEELSILENRGQPAETFNVIKIFSRMLVGYYSTVINAVRAEPTSNLNQTQATLMTDIIASVFEDNDMETEGDKLKLSAFISGLMISKISPVKTGQKDQFGRPIYRIELGYVPDHECILDPMSTEDNYEDARFLHRFKWVPEETIVRVWGKKVLKDLEAFDNFLNIDEAEYDYNKQDGYYGRYKVFNSYLLVHTVIVDDNNRRWSIIWCGDKELDRKEITYREVKWPYRVTKLHYSNKSEYYGIFRDVKESQKAINQALIKLQLMVNTQKAFVEDGGVRDLQEFAAAFNRVNGVIPVRDLSKIKIENMTHEALEQYAIIDKAFDRIQRMLSINDSFLGMAFAADSGRKVKLQQNATVMALRYLTVRIEAFYKTLGEDICNLVKQFFTANQVLRVTDEITGRRFIELNRPMQVFSGTMDEQGNPIMEPMYEKHIDPDTGKYASDDEGNWIYSPIPEEETEIQYSKFDIKIASTVYNDEDERSQLMIETIMSGAIGQMLAQVNPVGFFKMAGLTMRTFKTRYSPEISRILEDTAQALSENPEAALIAQLTAQDIKNVSSNKSKTLKLPTNTNESGDVL